MGAMEVLQGFLELCRCGEEKRPVRGLGEWRLGRGKGAYVDSGRLEDMALRGGREVEGVRISTVVRTMER